MKHSAPLCSGDFRLVDEGSGRRAASVAVMYPVLRGSSSSPTRLIQHLLYSLRSTGTFLVSKRCLASPSSDQASVFDVRPTHHRIHVFVFAPSVRLNMFLRCVSALFNQEPWSIMSIGRVHVSHMWIFFLLLHSENSIRDFTFVVFFPQRYRGSIRRDLSMFQLLVF